VATFDGRDDVFLECASARIRLGPLWTPWLTLAVLRIGHEDHPFNALARAPLSRVRLKDLTWSFETANAHKRLSVRFESRREHVVGLRYRNPPGGERICLNSKLARVNVSLERRGQDPLHFQSTHGGAFEVLGEDDLGVPMAN